MKTIKTMKTIKSKTTKDEMHSPVKKNLPFKAQPVVQYTLEGKFVREYASMKEAAKILGIYIQSIMNCIRRKGKSANHYQWRLKKDTITGGKIMDIEPVKYRKGILDQYFQEVCQYGADGKFIREYPSILEAAGKNMTYKGYILGCANNKLPQYGGYRWRFKKEVAKDGKIMDIEPVKTISPDYFRGVCQFERDGKFVQEYTSILDAANKNLTSKHFILRCANKKMESTAGYRWRFLDEVVKDGKIIDLEPLRCRKRASPGYFRGVCQFEKDGKFIRQYPSILEAANNTQARKYLILRCANKKMKSSAGYRWRFLEEVVEDGKIIDLEPTEKKCKKSARQKKLKKITRRFELG
jgi:hypothetical protein